MAPQRIEATCTAVSWIPSEAMEGLMRLPLDIGLGHYDPPPPDRLDDLTAYVEAGYCRFANRLEAWADVEDGRVVDAGCSGTGLVGNTAVNLGPARIAVPAVAYPEICSTETDCDRSITFIQTAGGRTGAPFPRRVTGRRLARLTAPTAWTSVALTLNGDGSVAFRPRGASRFPRHWFYGTDGCLTAKSATIDYQDWVSSAHEEDTPWGDGFRSIEIAACETALERMLSILVMQGQAKPSIRTVPAGQALMRNGERATTMMLILDGLVEISIDGSILAESGPGALLGERAMLEGGARTATVTARTPVKVAEFAPQILDENALTNLRTHHQREFR